jgi:TetR/AcrR family tetracycline transcriptional repressor
MPNLSARLSRDRVVEAGLTLIDDKGVDAFTMRGLAQALDVTPMALYNHFTNKRDLLRSIADHVIGGAEFDGHQSDWKDQIRHCFRAMRRICLQHPGLPRLLELEGAAPASVRGPMDVTVNAFAQAGLDELDSLRAFFVLIGFTLSQAAYQTRGPLPGLEPSQRLAEWDFDAAFEYGLEVIILGAGASANR